MEQAVEVLLPPRGSFGALVRACRHRAFLSQEQLAERAELSERTVRNLEAQRVRLPRPDTVRLLADALELTGPERAGWFAAARGADHRPSGPPAGGAVRLRPGVPVLRPADPPGRGPGNPGRRWPGPARAVADVAGPADPAAPTRAGWPALEACSGGTGGLSGAARCELAELRQENRRLREDLQILKRAAAIFAARAG